MATSKLWSVHNSVGGTLSYIEDEEKTTASLSELIPNVTDGIKCEGGKLVAGINCTPATAEVEMEQVKDKFGKHGGVTAYHGYISFGAADKLSAVDVLEVARQIAKEMWGDKFQVLLAVHNNTGTLHCHFVVNSVSFIDGHKAVDNEHNYYYLRNVVDRICKENNLTVTEQHSKPALSRGDIGYAISLAIAEGGGDPDRTAEEFAKLGFKVCAKNSVRGPDGKRYYTTSFDPSFKVEKPSVSIIPENIQRDIEIPELDLSNLGRPLEKESKEKRAVIDTNIEPSAEPELPGVDLPLDTGIRTPDNEKPDLGLNS